jgi:DNA-binding LytR/AlgR family response regulator
MTLLSCIIVEDEKPAQEVLRSYIQKTEWIELKAVFSEAVSAMEYLQSNDVDLMFLDIQMPVLTGVDFLKAMKMSPQVIITSAYSEYAIEAFELDVRDYLMKPFSFDRFLKAVGRVSQKPAPSSVHQLQPSAQHERSFAFFNVNKTMVKVVFDDILYVESMREYVYIHTSRDKIVTKFALSDMEKMLGNSFMRIHRSFIVNLHQVDAYNAEEIMVGKVQLPIGTNYKKPVEAQLQSMDIRYR